MIHTKILVPVAAFVTPHPDMGAKHTLSLITHAPTINQRRKDRVTSDSVYANMVATPAADKFKERVSFPTPTQGDRNALDIYSLQRGKMLRAYNKYNDALDATFETVDGVEAKKFKEAVESKQSNWEEEAARGTLRFTGSKARGRQVASVMGYWLTGDTQALDRLPEGSQVLAGGPYDIALTDLRATFRVSLTQLLVQTGIIISESGYHTDMLTRHNGRIKSMLENISDPAKAATWVTTRIADKSYCIWFMEDGQLKLETQIYTA